MDHRGLDRLPRKFTEEEKIKFRKERAVFIAKEKRRRELEEMSQADDFEIYYEIPDEEKEKKETNLMSPLLPTGLKKGIYKVSKKEIEYQTGFIYDEIVKWAVETPIPYDDSFYYEKTTFAEKSTLQEKVSGIDLLYPYLDSKESIGFLKNTTYGLRNAIQVYLEAAISEKTFRTLYRPGCLKALDEVLLGSHYYRAYQITDIGLTVLNFIAFLMAPRRIVKNPFNAKYGVHGSSSNNFGKIELPFFEKLGLILWTLLTFRLKNRLKNENLNRIDVVHEHLVLFEYIVYVSKLLCNTVRLSYVEKGPNHGKIYVNEINVPEKRKTARVSIESGIVRDESFCALFWTTFLENVSFLKLYIVPVSRANIESPSYDPLIKKMLDAAWALYLKNDDSIHHVSDDFILSKINGADVPVWCLVHELELYDWKRELRSIEEFYEKKRRKKNYSTEFKNDVRTPEFKYPPILYAYSESVNSVYFDPECIPWLFLTAEKNTKLQETILSYYRLPIVAQYVGKYVTAAYAALLSFIRSVFRKKSLIGSRFVTYVETHDGRRVLVKVNCAEKERYLLNVLTESDSFAMDYKTKVRTLFYKRFAMAAPLSSTTSVKETKTILHHVESTLFAFYGIERFLTSNIYVKTTMDTVPKELTLSYKFLPRKSSNIDDWNYAADERDFPDRSFDMLSEYEAFLLETTEMNFTMGFWFTEVVNIFSTDDKNQNEYS